MPAWCSLCGAAPGGWQVSIRAAAVEAVGTSSWNKRRGTQPSLSGGAHRSAKMSRKPLVKQENKPKGLVSTDAIPLWDLVRRLPPHRNS